MAGRVARTAGGIRCARAKHTQMVARESLLLWSEMEVGAELGSVTTPRTEKAGNGSQPVVARVGQPPLEARRRLRCFRLRLEEEVLVGLIFHGEVGKVERRAIIGLREAALIVVRAVGAQIDIGQRI